MGCQAAKRPSFCLSAASEPGVQWTACSGCEFCVVHFHLHSASIKGWNKNSWTEYAGVGYYLTIVLNPRNVESDIGEAKKRSGW